MSERLRKSLVYLSLVVTIIWGAWNFSDTGKRPATSARDAEKAPTQSSSRTTLVPQEVDWYAIDTANWGRNPFGRQRASVAYQPTWRLKGIVYNTAHPLAYINGQRLGVGDIVNNAEIKNIGRNSVTLAYRGRNITLHLHEG